MDIVSLFKVNSKLINLTKEEKELDIDVEITKEEIKPTSYEWPDDEVSLERVQSIWEANARKLIVQKFLSEQPSVP